MDLFYLALALTGMGPRHSGETTQIILRATSRQFPLPTAVLPLDPQGVSPAQLHKHTQKLRAEGAVTLSLLLLPLARLWARNSGPPLSTQQEVALPLRQDSWLPSRGPSLNFTRLQAGTPKDYPPSHQDVPGAGLVLLWLRQGSITSSSEGT